MSTTKGTRPIDANNLARRIREYMDDFPNATTRLATCRAILSMLGDEKQTPTLRPVSREQVEKARGEWRSVHGLSEYYCSRCGEEFEIHSYDKDKYRFCPYCMTPMTDKAVQMVMERVEALHAEN